MSFRIAAGPKRVEIAAIERELEQLWISLPRSGDAMSMRAVVANLLAIRDSEAASGQALEVLGNLIGAHPCRVIALVSEPDLDPPELAADVAVICQNSETCPRCVCCDRIRLAGRGIMADNLPSAAAGLLLPDLPVILWCLKPPFERKDFLDFAAYSNRVIVDSSGYARGDLERLARFVETSRRLGAAVSDLNWARLTPCRQVFAQFFDSLECRDHLAAIHSLRVAAPPAMGLLLAGWLKAQLDKSGYPLPRERIAVEAASSAFEALAMTCAQGQDSFTVTRRNDLTLEARSVLDGKEAVRVVKAEPAADSKLLGDELAFAGRDTVFETALAAAIGLQVQTGL